MGSGVSPLGVGTPVRHLFFQVDPPGTVETLNLDGFQQDDLVLSMEAIPD